MSWRILVVEDDPDIREALELALHARGYRVSTAVHGQAAIEACQREGARPAVILLDLMMPVMDGYELLERQAAEPLLADVPVIVSSAQRPIASFPSTVRAVLGKPTPLPRLLETIRAVCADTPAEGVPIARTARAG
jgi:CheY-like chemotaxis protein